MGEMSVEKLILFFLIALPGAISIRVYALWCPTSQKDWKDSLTDAIIYSVVGLAMWVMLFPTLIRSFVTTAFLDQPQGGSRRGLAIALLDHQYLLILYTVVTPVVLACTWYQLRRHVFPAVFGFDHPTRTAWDWLFERKKNLWLWLHLKQKDANGKAICKGGLFGGTSYVSSYPYDQEIYLEKAYSIDENNQAIIEVDENGVELDPSKGLLVRGSEIERIEVYEVPETILPTFWGARLHFFQRLRKLLRRWIWIEPTHVEQDNGEK